MAHKVLVFAALLAIARASILPASQPLVQAAPVAAVPITRTVVAQPYDPNPQYSYGYEVQDPLTGDSHGQVESRSGGVVKGSYALLDSDGTRRVVDYTADPINGFNAVVSKQPIVRTVAAVPAAPVAIAPPQPVLRTVSSVPVAVAPPQQVLRTVSSIPVAVAPPQPILRTVPSLPVAPIAVAPPQPIVRTVLNTPWATEPIVRTSVSAGPWASEPILRAAPVVSAGPWAGEPIVRAAPAVPAGPWAGEPIVRAAPAVSAGPWAGEPIVRAAPAVSAGPWAAPSW